MTTHYADFAATPGLTFSSVTLWTVLPNSTTAALIATATAVVEHNPGTGRYRATFDDIAEGTYRIRGMVSLVQRADWHASFAGTNNEIVGAQFGDVVVSSQENADEVLKLLKADAYIDKTTTPWELVLVDYPTTGTGGVELLRKKLYDVDGVSITDTNTVIGQASE